MIFQNRRHAGRMLAERLDPYRAEDPIIAGLPRGGLPVADEVARALDAPLDVLLVRKLGVPFQPELGMGAIGEDGVRVLNDEIVHAANISEVELSTVEQRERQVLEDRARRYRGDRPTIPLAGRTVIIVDDGIATGGTACAAARVARARGARRVVVAVPVAAPESIDRLAGESDEVVALEAPRHLVAVGAWYDDFRQTSDDEVVRILDAASHRAAAPVGDPPATAIDEEVRIPADGQQLEGHLTVPAGASGLVLFAHGSGSSRHSPRNRSVAAFLQQGGVGTLLFDLLSADEATDRRAVFDIPLLAARLTQATHWVTDREDARNLRIGYFGASTGAGAALWAAAEPDARVDAIVSRGGRPDLAGARLAEVRAPTLLIVGSRDDIVLDLNRDAARAMRCEHRVAVVPGASHLFEEPGTLAQAAQLARDWFVERLGAGMAHTVAGPAATRARGT